MYTSGIFSLNILVILGQIFHVRTHEGKTLEGKKSQRNRWFEQILIAISMKGFAGAQWF